MVWFRNDWESGIGRGFYGGDTGKSMRAQDGGTKKREDLKTLPYETDADLIRAGGYTLNELPQPQVLFTLGLLNLKPEPSMDSI